MQDPVPQNRLHALLLFFGHLEECASSEGWISNCSGTRGKAEVLEQPYDGEDCKRGPDTTQSAAAINSRSCGRGTANAAAEMEYINVSAVLASSDALLSAGVFIINYY